MLLIDMHIHSVYSDGMSDVSEIAAGAKKRGISLLALTDHDTVDGVGPFMEACNENKIAAVSGVELAADAPYTLHILGYRVDWRNEGFLAKLSELKNGRKTRNEKICANLRALGIDITVDDAEAAAEGDVIARPHIASAMCKKGYVSSFGEAFAKYIGEGAIAYADRELLSPEGCIDLINDAGGVAVMAHPLQTELCEEDMLTLLKRLKNAGLWGIEATYTGHTPEQIYTLMKLGSQCGLAFTAGSDFHGPPSALDELGMSVSEDYLPWARLGISL
jgi:predicted metal-dependent phosphoesterase TrpH